VRSGPRSLGFLGRVPTASADHGRQLDPLEGRLETTTWLQAPRTGSLWRGVQRSAGFGFRFEQPIEWSGSDELVTGSARLQKRSIRPGGCRHSPLEIASAPRRPPAPAQPESRSGADLPWAGLLAQRRPAPRHPHLCPQALVSMSWPERAAPGNMESACWGASGQLARIANGRADPSSRARLDARLPFALNPSISTRRRRPLRSAHGWDDPARRGSRLPQM
jgi:hypothetical protein